MRERIDGSERRNSAFVDVDFEVVRAVFGKCVGLGFAENISILMVVLGNPSKIWQRFGGGGATSEGRRSGVGGQIEREALGAWQLTSASESSCADKRTAGGVTEVGGSSSVVVGAPDADVMEGWSDGRSVGVVRKCMLCFCQSIKGL